MLNKMFDKKLSKMLNKMFNNKLYKVFKRKLKAFKV